MPNLIILENQALVSKGIALIIESDPNNHILQISSHPDRFMSFLKTHHREVDLAILDIELSDTSLTGLDVAAMIREDYPAIRIMFLTSYKRCEFIVPVFGQYESYLYKDVHPNELKKAIQDICTPGKGTYYSADAMSFYYQCMQQRRPDLSEEMIQILRLIANGYTNPEIADRLTSPHKPLTENSIRERRRKLRFLLQASNSPQVIAKALKYGFLDTSDIE